MNWLSKIKNILGVFWTTIFHDTDFILGVENLHALASKKQEASHKAWTAGSIANSDESYACRLPFVIYIEKAKSSSESTTLESSICHPAAAIVDILRGSAATGDIDTDGEYIGTSLYTIPEPHHITDHVVDYNYTMFNNMDYTWHAESNEIWFHTDPERIGFECVTVMDSDNILHVYYKMFGWVDSKKATKDMVTAFEGTHLNDQADIVWNMHQCGATFQNVKDLLGSITDSVISKADGAVTSIWTEQNYTCVLIDGLVYSAPTDDVTCNVSVGDTVHEGDIIFGSLKMYTQNDTPTTADVPGIRVMTDVGELTAPNSSSLLNATVSSGVKILPLSGSAAVVNAYNNRCVDLYTNSNCPVIEVPDTVNPFLFVMRTLRQGRSVFISMTTEKLHKVSEALACIRKSISADSMLTVYIQAEGDIVGTTVSSFTVEAGNAAVAVDATITIQDMSAEASIKI